jgi:hypothetical protein
LALTIADSMLAKGLEDPARLLLALANSSELQYLGVTGKPFGFPECCFQSVNVPKFSFQQ